MQSMSYGMESHQMMKRLCEAAHRSLGHTFPRPIFSIRICFKSYEFEHKAASCVSKFLKST